MTKLTENNGSIGGTGARYPSYTYTDDGWLTTLSVYMDSTHSETTEWAYGVTTATGSDINIKRLVSKKI